MKIITRYSILLSLLFLLSGCTVLNPFIIVAASQLASPVSYALDRPFKIRYGEQIMLKAEKLTVRFEDVSTDSRCPAQVTCVMRGYAKIVISLQQGDDQAQRIELATDPAFSPLEAGSEDPNYRVTLAALDPLPDQAGQSIPLQQYVATIIVSQAPKTASDITATAVTAQLGEPFTFQPGQWATLANTPDNLSIHFQAVIEDSRCPALVDCAWSGQALVRLSFRQDGILKPLLLELNTLPIQDQNKVQFANYEIELQDLDPKPQHDSAKKEIKPDDYQATLVVRKVDLAPTATATPAETATSTPPLTPTPALTPIRMPDKTLDAPLDAPFILRLGQTAAITDEDFKVTLRSVTDDSGCFSEDDCSSMTFNGTLALQKGEDKQLLQLMVAFHPESPFATDFADYTVQLIKIQKAQEGDFEATLMVIKTSAQIGQQNNENPQLAPTPTEPTEAPLIEPLDYTPCSELSKNDAEALLDMPVQAATQLDPQSGLCSYRSIDPSETADQAPYFATSGLLRGKAAALVIRQIVDTIHTEYPQADESAYLNIGLMLDEGSIQDSLYALPALVEGVDGWQAASLPEIGDNAVWLWGMLQGKQTAFLLAAQGDQAILFLTADVRKNRPQTDVRTAMTAVAQKRTMSQESVPTPAALRCEAITQAEAEAILGESVHNEPTLGDEVCGFDSMATRAGGDSTADSLYFAVAGIFDQNKTPEYLLNLATGLREENPNASKLSYATIKGLLADGLVEDAFTLLPELAKGASTVEVQTVTKIGKTALWFWGPINGSMAATIVALDQNDRIIVVFAQVNEQRTGQEVLAAMTPVARKLITQAEAKP